MLAMEKEMLFTNTMKEVSHLRDIELQYYLEHTGSIQTMATLLAGFAFTAFVSMDTIPLSLETLRFETATGDYAADNINTTLDYSIKQVVEKIDGLAVASFVFHAIEVSSVCACLGEMLHVMTETMIARLLGSRLALRGPDGSIIRATTNLAKSLASSTRRFIWGLQATSALLILPCHPPPHPCSHSPLLS